MRAEVKATSECFLDPCEEARLADWLLLVRIDQDGEDFFPGASFFMLLRTPRVHNTNLVLAGGLSSGVPGSGWVVEGQPRLCDR